jgi:DNA modification methylase
MMGSGTTGIAALQLKRRFIGVDKKLQAYNLAVANIAKASF